MVRERLRSVFAKRDDPYAGVDLANASRFGGAVWFLGGFLVAVLLPFVHPNQASIGNAGWILAGLAVAGSVVAGLRMRYAGAEASVNETLFFSYAAIASIALLVWLAGGVGSPFGQLYLLSVVYTAAVHPPRRVLVYIGALVVFVLLPLAYQHNVSGRAALDLATELFVWLALSFVLMFLMTYIRAQRLGLRAEGEQARRQARLDTLTGLLNRRAFDEDLRRAIERARANHEPLSVLVGDLDDFKDFNDRFGHLEGDRVLKIVADSLRSALRRPDIAYRWGGDEFAAILPQADSGGAELVSERVEVAVGKTKGPDDEPLRMATGVAQFTGSDGPEALLDAADRALMRAKGSGAFELREAQG